MAKPRYAPRGRTVLITGAARGIGADAARRLASRGARVSLVGLEPDQLARIARECGPDAVWFECDVTDPESLDAAVAGTVERTGGIDVVVANAGIAASDPVAAIDPVVFERVIEVNLLGVWRTIRAALPHVIERKGYLLPVASLAAVAPAFLGIGAYSASKAGVEAFARTLSVELDPLGVDVGVAYFSWIATDMVAGGEENPAFHFLRSRMPGPSGKTYPVSAAGAAIADGIERRARVVAAPGWIKAALLMRGLLAPLAERQFKREAPEALRVFEEARAAGQIESGAVGAGGHADEVGRHAP